MSWINKNASRKMMAQLTTQFLLVSLTPLLLILGPAYMGARTLLTQQIHDKLSAKASSRQQIIHTYMAMMTRRAALGASSVAVADGIKALGEYAAATQTLADGALDVTSAAYLQLWEHVHQQLLHIAKEGEYADYYLIDAQSGLVLFNYSREPDLGTNLQKGAYKTSHLASLVARTVASNQVLVSDYAWYEAAKKPAMFIAAPVHDAAGKIIGVAALQLDGKVLDHFIGDTTGLGATGEAYVVGPDFLMRSESRFFKDTSLLRRKADTTATRAALAGQSGILVGADYRGAQVVSHYAPLGIKELTGLDWAVIVDIDTAEVYAPIDQLGWRMLLEGLVGVLVILAASWWFSRRMAGPLVSMAEAVAKVAEGDLTVQVSTGNRDDQVGQIAQSFIKMTGRLRQQATAIAGNTSTIAAATAQITTSMAELASSVSETATAVAETSATTEEVKQTSLLASQKAQLVADNARRAVDLANDSQGATERTLADLGRLQEQMNGVASRMYRLSEQTRSIGTVITTVNEIFDQANLLAVNAAIEAAKAGEHGRGFGVVAQEIRALAERSRQATTEIPVILSEIERAASAAVAATETGTRSIEMVMGQSTAAGGVVRELSSTLAEAVQAANQILVSGQQQVIGMNQVAGAIESIRLASAQNADGARAVQESSRALDEVGRDLQLIVDWYKV